MAKHTVSVKSNIKFRTKQNLKGLTEGFYREREEYI